MPVERVRAITDTPRPELDGEPIRVTEIAPAAHLAARRPAQ